jgi:hypothetical protein
MNRTDIVIVCLIICFTSHNTCLAQVNEDSLLLAHSVKWEVKQNKGLFGLAKPDFGSYATLGVARIDSAVLKKKTKDSSYAGIDVSGEGSSIDLSKYMTIEKKKFYNLKLASIPDTIESVFAIASVSHEKRKTFLGTMLSKNDESTDDVLDYNRDVPGVITTGHDSLLWQFLIENFTSGGRQTETSFAPMASISGGYLKKQNDSLYMQIYSSFTADIILVDPNGKHLAGLAFKQKHPEIWIRNDINISYQHAIAALFAVIIAIKDY